MKTPMRLVPGLTALALALPAGAQQADAAKEPLLALEELLTSLLPASFFEYELLGLELWQWLALLVVAFLAAATASVASGAILRVLRKVSARTTSPLDDRMIERTRGPLGLGLGILVFRIGVAPLRLGADALELLGEVMSALLVVTVAWLLVRATEVLSRRIEERLVERGQADAVPLVLPGRKAVKIVIWVLGFVAVLDNFGFSVTALVASLGVGGIAIALAAQKTVENLFGGLALYADRPIRVGDFGRFGSWIGTVETIGVRSTRIRTLDRTLVTIPNADFSGLQIESFAERDQIRFYTVMGVRYETAPEQLRWLLVEIRKLLYAHERVTPDPARIRFIGFGAYSLDLEIFAYVDTPDWNEFLGIREDLLLRIMDLVDESGTGFAFPSQTLYLGPDGAPTEERAREIAEQVARWREERSLPLPDFPPERISELAKTVTYPPEGAATG